MSIIDLDKVKEILNQPNAELLTESDPLQTVYKFTKQLESLTDYQLSREAFNYLQEVGSAKILEEYGLTLEDSPQVDNMSCKFLFITEGCLTDDDIKNKLNNYFEQYNNLKYRNPDYVYLEDLTNPTKYTLYTLITPEDTDGTDNTQTQSFEATDDMYVISPDNPYVQKIESASNYVAQMENIIEFAEEIIKVMNNDNKTILVNASLQVPSISTVCAYVYYSDKVKGLTLDTNSDLITSKEFIHKVLTFGKCDWQLAENRIRIILEKESTCVVNLPMYSVIGKICKRNIKLNLIGVTLESLRNYSKSSGKEDFEPEVRTLTPSGADNIKKLPIQPLLKALDFNDHIMVGDLTSVLENFNEEVKAKIQDAIVLLEKVTGELTCVKDLLVINDCIYKCNIEYSYDVAAIDIEGKLFSLKGLTFEQIIPLSLVNNFKEMFNSEEFSKVRETMVNKNINPDEFKSIRPIPIDYVNATYYAERREPEAILPVRGRSLFMSYLSDPIAKEDLTFIKEVFLKYTSLYGIRSNKSSQTIDVFGRFNYSTGNNRYYAQVVMPFSDFNKKIQWRLNYGK